MQTGRFYANLEDESCQKAPWGRKSKDQIAEQHLGNDARHERRAKENTRKKYSAFQHIP